MGLFETGVRPAVDKWLLDKSKEERDYGDYWSASSAGYCMRKVIFERLGVPPVAEDARKQRVFSSGDIFHQWMQEITKSAGLSIAQELELQDEELMIRGHIDDLVIVQAPTVPIGEPKAGIQQIEPPEPLHLILYDYKTVHSRSFHYSKGRDMSHYHRMQLGTYMYMLRSLPPVAEKSPLYPVGGFSNLTEARILRISKDDLVMEEQQLLWTPDLEKDIVSYWSTLNGYWKEKKFPRCTCGDYEINQKTGIGFMADPKYNPFYYEKEPCSLKWLSKCKAEGLLK